MKLSRDRSLPMFRAEPGYRGVLMMRRGPECTVVTLWEHQASAEALACSARYRETVAAIMAAGFLAGDQTLSYEDAQLADFP
jgi:heme-degrading monooxygenase HmoA